MAFTSSLNFKETLTQEASGSLTLLGSGSTGRTDLFTINGNNGTLFSVSDDLSNSLFSVNTIAGLPVIEAFADNTVVMGQYGQNVLVVTGSKVGVGTSTPQGKLSVDGGDFRFNYGNTAANYYVYLNHNGGQDGGILWTRDNSTFDWQISNLAANGDLSFYAYGAGSTAVTFQRSNGNVGIGTTTPGSYKLNIAGATSTQGLYIPGLYTFGQSSSGIEMQLASTSYNAIRFFQGTDYTGVIHSFGRSWSGGLSVGMINIEGYNGVTIGVWNNPTATFLSSGNVGIGVPTPGVKLHIQGSNITDSAIRITNAGTGGISWDIYSTNNGFDQGGGKLLFYRPAADGTSGTVVFDNSGNVGIGTTSPTTKLHVVNEAFIGNSGGTTGLLLSGDNNSRIDFRSGSASTGQITCGNSSNLFIDAFDSRAIELAIAGTTIFEVSNTPNVGIGTAGSVDPSALLEVKSNTQGFLPPRMDEAERDAIGGPAIGLMVFNLGTDEVNVYTGAGWKRIQYI